MNFFQHKNCWHFEFLMNQIPGQKFILFENPISNVYCKEFYGKTIQLYDEFWRFMKSYYVTNIFNLKVFDNETTTLLNFFARKYVLFLCFSAWKKY